MLKSIWIHDNYLKHKHLVESMSKQCNVNMSTFAPFEDCLNFTSLEKNYILLTQNFVVKHYYPECLKHEYPDTIINGELVTWREASDICRELGGYLPFLQAN